MKAPIRFLPTADGGMIAIAHIQLMTPLKTQDGRWAINLMTSVKNVSYDADYPTRDDVIEGIRELAEEIEAGSKIYGDRSYG